MPALRRAPARAGQAAVMVALTLFSLVVFMAMATNMGILVNDRVRMQNAADLAAYGAAYREAQQLNRLVQINREIAEEVQTCRDSLTSTIWTGSECLCIERSYEAELVIQGCQATLDVLAIEFVIQAGYNQSVQPALDVAQATLGANVEGLDDPNHHDLFTSGSPTTVGAFTTEGTPSIANYIRVTDTKVNYPVFKMCQCISGCCPVGPVPSIDYNLNTWYHKDNRQPDIWVMVEAEGTMESRYMDIDSNGGGQGYFGSSSDGGRSDRMFAVGVAKPYDGSVGPSEADDQTRTGNVRQGPYWTSPGVELPLATMVEEYRARLAGIAEWEQGAATTFTPRTTLQSKFSDVSKFMH